MSSDKSLVVGEVIDHDESIGKELGIMHQEVDAIHSDLTSTAEHHDDGEEIIALALEGASVQSLPRINVYENIPFAGGDGDYQFSQFYSGHTQLEKVYSVT